VDLSLKDLWNKYKDLSLGYKILLFFPLLLIFCIGLIWLLSTFFVKSRPTPIEAHKEQLDGLLEANKKKIEVLNEEEVVISLKQEELEQELEKNEKEMLYIVNRIDNAAQREDLEELEKIRREIINK
jgi:hypothetical protein